MAPSKIPKIVFLGTGNPNADPLRMGPSLALIVKSKAYLVDAGVGLVRRAAEAFERGIPELEVKNLQHIFITHLHSDHTLGLPDLILSPWVLGRKEPLMVYGPPGTRKMCMAISKAYEKDISIRLNGLEPANNSGYRTIVQEFQADSLNQIFEDQNLRIFAFPVNHGNWHAYGFRFETRNAVVVLSGDTAPFEKMAEYYTNCDLLIHEAYCQAGFEDLPKNWQTYHRRMHTSAVQLGEIASEVHPQHLVLYHQLLWGKTEEILIREVGLGFSGKVTSSQDLDIISMN